jgi:hypothetical protein
MALTKRVHTWDGSTEFSKKSEPLKSIIAALILSLNSRMYIHGRHSSADLTQRGHGQRNTCMRYNAFFSGFNPTRTRSTQYLYEI